MTPEYIPFWLPMLPYLVGVLFFALCVLVCTRGPVHIPHYSPADPDEWNTPMERNYR